MLILGLTAAARPLLAQQIVPPTGASRPTRTLTEPERILVWGTAALGTAGFAFSGAVVAVAVCASMESPDAGHSRFDCTGGDDLRPGIYLGALVGAAMGAAGGARWAGCPLGSALSRGARGALLGTAAALPIVALYYAADGRRSEALRTINAFTPPTLQFVGAALAAQRCPVPIPVMY